MREVLEPTAARASFPAKRPTTTTSAALNSSWRRLEAISGRANSRILSASDPLHMSMLCFFLTIPDSPLVRSELLQLDYLTTGKPGGLVLKFTNYDVLF